jgi:hypothetical protein
MKPMQERRKSSRLSFATECELIAAGKSFPTALIDISIKGALVERPAGWPDPAPQPCDLRVLLGDAQVEFHMMVEVTHAEPHQLGLRCLSIDVESVTHLRRLLELNFGDPTLVERELVMLG